MGKLEIQEVEIYFEPLGAVKMAIQAGGQVGIPLHRGIDAAIQTADEFLGMHGKLKSYAAYDRPGVRITEEKSDEEWAAFIGGKCPEESEWMRWNGETSQGRWNVIIFLEEARFIHIRKLVKSYTGPHKEVEVLKGLELRVDQGDTISIVGASGTGKSTLLHIMGTLDRPTRGRVIVAGRDLSTMDEASLAAFRNHHIGFVFQFHHLLPEFNALENVMMPALIARWEKDRARERARRLLEEVGLGHRTDHRVGELSGGEQQRVAVARALVLGPKVLLADEPTGNLDERTGRKVQEMMMQLNEDYGLTTLVATHNEYLARAMARSIRLVDGLAVEQ